MLEHLAEEGEVTRLFRESSGVCLPHFRVALGSRDREAGFRTLVQAQRTHLEALHRELEEYLRKHDYRFSQEPYGSEADAFLRATGFLAGPWFDLPGCAALDSRGGKRK